MSILRFIIQQMIDLGKMCIKLQVFKHFRCTLFLFEKFYKKLKCLLSWILGPVKQSVRFVKKN